MDYSKALEHLKAHGYDSFTDLQEAAFTNPCIFDHNKDLFVIGQTSAGKTMIPLLLYSLAVEEAHKNDLPVPKMLFVVPYRALAAQKMDELQDFFKPYNFSMKIVQSTAEFRRDDDAIQKGEVDCAVIITEKAFKYESRNPEFFSKYDFIVLDEVGLLQHVDRGVRLDFIFAWGTTQKRMNQRHPRLIALGTPFFDWSAYVESYNFEVIEAPLRPVHLDEVVFTHKKHRIMDVSGPCDFLKPTLLHTPQWLERTLEKNPQFGIQCPSLSEEYYCYINSPCRLDETLICPKTNKPCSDPVHYTDMNTTNLSTYILCNICRRHLDMGHQILIFVNDRARVMALASRLYREMPEYFTCSLSDEECKTRLLSECGIEDDDVFGIMELENNSLDETEYYRAFMSGIGFHSAALPHELRSYVEDHFLESRDMKIVCSTETLAYGINSSVDVVIVADIYKQEGGDIRPLMLNEYRNYAGRAGRLRKDADVSELKGYVYTLVSDKQTDKWEELKRSAEHPEKLFSMFHTENEDLLPFFLVNLMPISDDSGITLEQLTMSASLLPNDGTMSDEAMSEKIRAALSFLEDNSIVVRNKTVPMGRSETRATEKYCLTESLGRNLRGLIIGSSDFEMLSDSINSCVLNIFGEPDRVQFLFRLLSTKHASSGLNGTFENSETKLTNRQIRKYIKSFYENSELDSSWIDSVVNNRLLFVLAALLAWCDGESQKTLFRNFGVHYALINRFAEKIAYLIEVAQVLLPSRMLEMWEKSGKKLSTWGVTIDDVADSLDKRKKDFHYWFSSLFFGINVDLTLKLQSFLKEQGTEEAENLAEALSFDHINPQTARRLRRFGIRYRFLKNPPWYDRNNVEARNNFIDQERRYISDVNANLGIPYTTEAYILKLFKAELPKYFKD